MYRRPCTQLSAAVLGIVVAAVVVAAGCGGGAGGGATDGERRVVRAPGFLFLAPVDWPLTRGPAKVTLRPSTDSDEFVSVAVYRLLKPFRPAIWPQVVAELDGIAERLATGLRGRVEERATLTVAGGRARSYGITFRKAGKEFVHRTTFVLRGNQEFELACRFEGSGPVAEACGLMIRTFKLE